MLLKDQSDSPPQVPFAVAHDAELKEMIPVYSQCMSDRFVQVQSFAEAKIAVLVVHGGAVKVAALADGQIAGVKLELALLI